MPESILDYVIQLDTESSPWLLPRREPVLLVTPIVEDDRFTLCYKGFRITSCTPLKDRLFRDASLMRKALDYLYLIQLK
ncbi:MAG: hypothetical protein PHQ25_02345 [Acidobacteriota bacterium]|nr:hypothetical protein [Acidobacteriota bacterium]MDW3229385.1 hypothetical protein [Acidobacteriota bacterium]MDY0230945.1 hypothetical protein [Candidatus Saccharicenans sp.]